jgi:hypothetical protein
LSAHFLQERIRRYIAGVLAHRASDDDERMRAQHLNMTDALNFFAP